MKKTSVSILLLLVLLVSGCTSTSRKKKSSKDSGESSQISNVSSKSAEQSSSQQSSASSSSSGASSIEPPPAGTEETRTIATSLDDFEEGTGFNAGGRQIDNHDENQSADKIQNAELLTTYFSSICNIEGMISSITYTALNTNPNRNNGHDIYLTIGTSEAGKIVWQSSTPMKKAVLKVNNYHKWYRDYATEAEEQWHTDSAKLVVNGSETDMTVTETNVEPTTRTVTFEPGTTFNSLTIENKLIGGTDHNRIFLESIEITWIY